VTRVFYADQNLYVYLQSYAHKQASTDKKDRHPGTASPPSMALIFFRNGVQVSEAGPYPAQSGKSGQGTASFFTQIPLAKFPPGRYWMQVNVLDPSANKVAFARVPLAIMPSPGSARPATVSGNPGKLRAPAIGGLGSVSR